MSLYFRVFLVLPEVALNVMGTMWIFCEVVQCSVADTFSSIVIQSEYDICCIIVGFLKAQK